MFSDYNLNRKCERKIRPNKYERQSPASFNWWLRLFELMETQFLVPSHKRKEVVQNIFPEKILTKILSVCSFDDEEETKALPQVQHERSVRLEFQQTERTSAVQCPADSSFRSDRSYYNKIIRYNQLPHEIGRLQYRKEKNAGPNNPYLNFFRGKPDKVAIWRDLPPLKIEEMDLNHKAEAITEAIAVEFVTWMQTIGSETQTSLDVPTVMKMFQIGFDEAAKSLQVTVKEMPAVTKGVAQKMKVPSKFVRAKLHEKIRNDIKAFNTPKKFVAFGTSLPHRMRHSPPKKDNTKRFLQSNVPENLVTMAAVWEGITHLRSTREYCKYLIAHPEIPSPKYLQNLGMLQPEYFAKPHQSIEVPGLTFNMSFEMQEAL